jgi:signal transduction histidine kinase
MVSNCQKADSLRLDRNDGGGLALSRTIIEAHGGRLWADHEQGQHGAIFRFTLQRA